VFNREDVLRAMERRATEAVPEGQPIIPDGAVALKEDMESLQQYITRLGYSVKFGTKRAVTTSNRYESKVQLTARCHTGELTDELLHVWNNGNERRGRYLEEARSEEHRFLSKQKHLSGSSNDRRFHQLELENYVRYLRASGEHIPIFVWKTFVDLLRQD
jgi:hypothetical protein